MVGIHKSPASWHMSCSPNLKIVSVKCLRKNVYLKITCHFKVIQLKEIREESTSGLSVSLKDYTEKEKDRGLFILREDKRFFKKTKQMLMMKTMTTMMTALLKHAVAFSKLDTLTLQLTPEDVFGQPEACNYKHWYVLEDEWNSYTQNILLKCRRHTHTSATSQGFQRERASGPQRVCLCVCSKPYSRHLKYNPYLCVVGPRISRKECVTVWVCVKETVLIKIRTASECSYDRNLLLVIALKHTSNGKIRAEASTHKATQNMINTNAYTQISGIFCGLLKPTMLDCSRLYASHNPLCVKGGDVSGASWFSVLVVASFK